MLSQGDRQGPYASRYRQRSRHNVPTDLCPRGLVSRTLHLGLQLGEPLPFGIVLGLQPAAGLRAQVGGEPVVEHAAAMRVF